MKRRAYFLCLSLCLIVPLFGKTLSLESLVAMPTNWQMTPEDFEAKFSEGDKQLFTWLTKDKSRAKLTRSEDSGVAFELFEGKVPVEEAVIDFDGGKLNLVTFSIYNRGDSAKILLEEFVNIYRVTGKEISKRLKVRPSARKANKQQGLQTEGFSWNSKRGIALLEHNVDALGGGAQEYLRLRIAKKGAKGGLAASMQSRRGGAAVRLSSLKNFVQKDADGNVFVSGIPMVDQGAKGYCVVASVQRLFEFFGIGADMHQIAEVAEADPERGTNTLLMAKSLDKIDYRFKMRLKIWGMQSSEGKLTTVDVKKGEYYIGKRLPKKKVMKMIKGSIDDGLPILWSLQLGKFPETPDLNPQTSGGHMRLIIGYNEEKGRIIFSDSWGAGHEFKTMDANHAYRATTGLFVLKPIVN